MRSFILMTVGLVVLVNGLPSQTCHAQNDGGIARLTSAACQPNSPVVENRLFGLQTGHYGFHYNCDHEEDKRNHPAICWRRADADQLPKRMGCFKRVRHEVAQVSRRILDGMCDAGCCCNNCRQQAKSTCACPNCLAGPTVDESLEHSLVAEAVPTTVAPTNLAPATGRRSGLIRLTQVDSFADTVQGNHEILASELQIESEATGLANPVARTASVVTTEVLATEVGAEPTDSHRLGLLERLKIIQSFQASDTTEVKKF